VEKGFELDRLIDAPSATDPPRLSSPNIDE